MRARCRGRDRGMMMRMPRQRLALFPRLQDLGYVHTQRIDVIRRELGQRGRREQEELCGGVHPRGERDLHRRCGDVSDVRVWRGSRWDGHVREGVRGRELDEGDEVGV